MDKSSIERLRNFLSSNILKELMDTCITETQVDGIILHCPNQAIAEFIFARRELLLRASQQLTLGKYIKLMVGGKTFVTLPTHLEAMQILHPSKDVSLGYSKLLEIAQESPHGTYITLLPTRQGRSVWQWGDPIRCILTSDGVKKFSHRPPFDFHGMDVTSLYDQKEMERQINALIAELERSPHPHVRIKDFSYITYLADPAFGFPQLRKNPDEKYSYNADFEMIHIEEMGIIRICHCKERVKI